MKEKSTLSRRVFVKKSAGAAALLAMPEIIPSGVFGANDKVRVAVLGVNGRGTTHIEGYMNLPDVEVACLCDPDLVVLGKRAEEFEKKYSKKVMQQQDLRKVYEDKSIDAVSIATPNHWHALAAIWACQAGKDVYVQKPLSYTIQEALVMTRVANDNKRVVQVGSQQRSSKEFQKAIELVQKGAIGHIEKIYAKVGDPPKPFDLPEMPIPGNLNWNLWLGPLNDGKIHYHSDLAPQITLDPVQNETLWGAWRWYLEMGNGYTADWGAHMFDIAQAAIGMDGSAPCEVIPKGYNGTQYMTFKYKTGVVMTEQPYLEDNPGAQGIKFIGTKGWIEVARGYIGCSDPSLIPADIAGTRPQPRGQQQRPAGQRPPQQQRPAPTREGLQFEISSPHMQNFIDAVRSRTKPIASIEVGCSTAITCCIGNIANELGRPVKWDPATYTFVDDKEACSHRLMHYEYRRPYHL